MINKSLLLFFFSFNLFAYQSYFYFVEKNNIQGIEEYLYDGNDINTRDRDGNTALIHAIDKDCKVNTIQYLIDNGIDINAKNKKGISAIMYIENSEALTVLLDNGADINAKDDNGLNTLFYVLDGGLSKERKENLANQLIDAGIDVNAFSDKKYSILMLAIDKGYTQLAKKIIDNGADLNLQDASKSETALMKAISKKQTDIAKYLIEKGANINLKDKDGNSELKYAVQFENLEIANQLIDKGIDVTDNSYYIRWVSYLYTKNKEYEKLLDIILEKSNGKYKKEITKLCKESISKEEKDLTIKLLNGGADLADSDLANKIYYTRMQDVLKTALSKGLSPNIVIYGDNTLLEMSITDDRYNIIEYILKNGYDINSKVYSSTLAEILLKNNRADLIGIALSSGSTLSKDIANKLLIQSVDKGDTNTLKLSLDSGANINFKDSSDKETSLIIASKNNDVDSVKILLSRGADINIKGSYNDTALSQAVKENHTDVVKVLLENKANPDDNICIYDAIDNNNFEIVKLLVENGANINLSKDYRKSVLITAYREQNYEGNEDSKKIFKYLLDKNVDVNIKDNDITIFNLAVIENDIELANTLLLKGATFDKNNILLDVKFNEDCLEMIKLLVSKGANVNAVDSQGNHFLTTACKSYQFEAVKFLVDNGANVNAKTYSGIPAVVYAYSPNKPEIYTYLLSKGANPNVVYKSTSFSLLGEMVKNNDIIGIKNFIKYGGDVNLILSDKQQTALMVASFLGFENIVSLLISAGAALNSKDDTGATSLMYATLYGHYKVVRLLIDAGANLDIVNNYGYTALRIAYENNNSSIFYMLQDAGATR